MKPKILAILPGLIPSTIIGVVTPVLNLHCAGQIEARVALETYVKRKDLRWCDLVILCRNTDPQTGRWFLELLQSKKPYIYDIDDNFFELASDTPIGSYHTAPERINMLKEYIHWADLVRVYSEPMFEKIKTLNSDVVKVNGPVDWGLLSAAQKTADKNVIKIVYATSRVNDKLADLFKPALEDVLQKYQERIEVYFLGYNPPEFKIYPNVFYRPLTLNYEQYLRYFSSVGFDIGLAPLPDDIFHRSKTNVKVREYGACRIAGIYSNVNVYSKTVIPGKTGILVENSYQAWFRALSELIENTDLRTQIQEQAYQFAQENFSQVAFDQLWGQQIVEVLKQPRKKEENYQHVVKVLQPNNLQSSSSHTVFSKSQSNRLRYVSNWIWFYNLLRTKFPRLIAGLRTEGIDYLVRIIRFYIETFWLLVKIRLKLFLFKTKSSSS